MSSTATQDVAEELDRHRRELTGFCYRMLGSAAEADDAVQETMVRAWRAAGSFEGRSSVRTWLYRIAQRVCIDMGRSPQRRARPMDLGPSSPFDRAALGVARGEHTFVRPVADDRVVDPEGDPAEVAEARESVRLAFVAALQHLPARQRAALLLCDVLRFPAAETAAVLGASVPAVNSALQRARATLAGLAEPPLDSTLDERHRALLDRYVDAFERYDVAELVTLMHHDVVLSMPPYDLWLVGTADLASWFVGPGAGCRGSRLVPVTVSGTAGFGSYKSAAPGRWEPWALQVVEVRDGRISAHHNFLDARFEDYGLPPALTDG
jgi:RNA polymerase sigma-70 factor (ECF subfamily)